MNELISTALTDRDITPLSNFPQFLINKYEKEILEWIFEYARKFEEPPQLSRLRREFEHFIPIMSSPPFPLADVYEMTLKRKRKEYAVTVLTSIIDEIPEKDDLDLSTMSKLMLELGNSSSDISRYSTFDRSRYFRGDSLKIGFNMIDRATGGIANGEMMLIAGRLGTGKSTLQQWITYKWWEEGRRILFISKEMLSTDVFSRIDAMVGKFNPLRIRTMPRSDIESELKVITSIAGSSKGEIIIPSRQISTPSQIVTLARHLSIDAVFVDGMYLLKPDGARGPQLWEDVKSVSNDLKQAALDLGKPFMTSTQLKRTGKRDEYDPEDLAYSDALGQDADFLVAIHPSPAMKNRIELQLIKNRFGPNIAELAYIDYDTMTIVDESVEGSVDDDDWKED